ncbi:formylglycine-generating enzyme family protein [Neisseria perflava]|uniref:formylglycine-generating enzyme family protein n=1 Tax=Neisseria perflava TaxID=33053 RepID=UPI0020A017B7|nr:formylglycine-generating enzyme family protein [Neisseria perflava]MCP1661239.1 formylglycine-generating enzyme required for sulfatase activity [Neisseria perflava]MCP1773270.1 formylglycine-generating enzyme required for sulfatase activity [Neisseria perflava]
MTFIQIPAGSYLMGSSEADADAREKPQHLEKIDRAFYIGQYEVTQGDWRKVMNEGAFDRDRSNPYYRLPGMAKRITRDNHPATVSWNDAQEFIAKLNALDPQHRYRLPTEAEWEYVARAGTTTRYFFGDSDRTLGDYAWYGENFATGGSHPVGSKQPNPWGVYDIYGNAWEWVQDSYRPTYDSAATEQKTVRGGSWHNTADGWHSAWRKPYDADYRGISVGFRLVMEDK